MKKDAPKKREQDRGGGKKREDLMRIGRSAGASYAWMRRSLKGKQSGWLPGAATVIKHGRSRGRLSSP